MTKTFENWLSRF